MGEDSARIKSNLQERGQLQLFPPCGRKEIGERLDSAILLFLMKRRKSSGSWEKVI
jgi:hypothetical protein